MEPLAGGEIWCNFPSCGAEHRASLIEETLAGLCLHKDFETPSALFDHLSSKTHALAIQTGEEGPIAQAISGIDIAAWDLAARRAGLPLFNLLGGPKDEQALPIYASGINPDDPLPLIDRCRQAGYRSFKLKIGFDENADLNNIDAIIKSLTDAEQFMVDANQAWNLSTAKSTVKKLAQYPLAWLEEPLRADRPVGEWHELAKSTEIPLAVGENIRGTGGFSQAIKAGCFKVIQPDMCKWGGFSGCLPVAKEIIASGIRYCPHYLGGGIGLMASAHLLAASGGDGLLEVDVNVNPLREALAQSFPVIDNGRFMLPPLPGLGAKPDRDSVKPYLVHYKEIF